MTAIVLRGDARALPLPDASIDLIVTSPPYFGLRSYADAGTHYAGQIGDEESPWAYLDALWECTAEWMRVLKPEGSLWVNLGDKYSTYEGPRRVQAPEGSLRARQIGASQEAARRHVKSAPLAYGVPYKSLMGLPWRYAIGCVDKLGLILRRDLIWSKPNGLPESVTDRCRTSHEYWFHFTREQRYFSALDEIREPHARIDPPRRIGTRNQTQRHGAATDNVGWKDHLVAHNPLGKVPGSVWEVPTQPLKVPTEIEVDHFAAFPMEFPRRLIQAWSPAGICIECGQGRRPIVERSVTGAQPTRRMPGSGRDPHSRHGQPDAGSTLRGEHSRAITGYACACPEPSAPTRPAIVLDPFGGTGTTALVASVLGRRGVTVDRSADYGRIAAWRTRDRGERARALGLPKPVVPEGHPTLFDEDAAP